MKNFKIILMLIVIMLTLTACKNEPQQKPDTQNTTAVTEEYTFTPDEKVQEIKDNFKPAGEVYGEEALYGYKVTPEYSFSYGENNRLEMVYYTYNGDDYIHTYDYYDEAQTLLIYTFCNDVDVTYAEFTYDMLKDIEGTQILNGYYVTNPIAE